MMPQIRSVMAYGNLDFDAALDLECDVFASMRYHAAVELLNASEEGRQYLADCKRLASTEPDYDSLRAMSGYKLEEV